MEWLEPVECGNPNMPKVNRVYGEILEELGKFDEARKIYLRAIELLKPKLELSYELSRLAANREAKWKDISPLSSIMEALERLELKLSNATSAQKIVQELQKICSTFFTSTSSSSTEMVSRVRPEVPSTELLLSKDSVQK